MYTIEDVQNFCNLTNYDIRISHNGRWIDQKCTPDVLWSISDFILDYVDNQSAEFTVKDIWKSDYARLTIAETYSKPGTDSITAENEYDKVFSQPINLLCYAGVINDIGRTNRHLYVVVNREMLEYIARNDIFALRFLQVYIEKVMRDSCIYGLFEEFFNHQNKNAFNALKAEFITFYHKYTPIQKDFEPKRIFTKVLNPLAYKNYKCGTEKGYMSKNIIIKADLMYNRDNFRDVYADKPKGIARKEWLVMHPKFNVRNGYFEQMMTRTKRTLKDYAVNERKGISELTQFNDNYMDRANATQLHHIFSKNEYPEIMHYLENLIALTPNQHYGFAHPNNNTHIIDPLAQNILLVAKTNSIEYNFNNEEPIYAFDNLLQVLSVGFDDNSALEIENNDFIDVLHFINCHYDHFAV